MEYAGSRLDTKVDTKGNPNTVPMLLQYTNDIGSRYFVDPWHEDVLGRQVQHFKILMGLFVYAKHANGWLEGDPQMGKTTFANVIGSVMSGLPFDLLDNLQLQGHQDQTRDMLIRADLAKLAEEGTVTQASLFPPTLLLDEFNGLSSGKQIFWREYLRKRAIEYLGRTYTNRNQTIFITLNPDRDGTYPVSDATRERFDISLEFGFIGSHYRRDIRRAKQFILDDLRDENALDQAHQKLLDKSVLDKDKIKWITDFGLKHGQHRDLKPIERSELNRMVVYAQSIPRTPAAELFIDAFLEEYNTTPRYGLKRRGDPIDDSPQNRDASMVSSKASSGKRGKKKKAPLTFPPLSIGALPLANACVQGSISSQFSEAVEDYAGLLAAALDDTCVDIPHLLTVMPYCLAHRAEFHHDYAGRYRAHPRLRGEREAMDLSRRLINEVKGRADHYINDARTLDTFAQGRQLKDGAQKRLMELMTRPATVLHPLLKVMVRDAWKVLQRLITSDKPLEQYCQGILAVSKQPLDDIKDRELREIVKGFKRQREMVA